MAGSQVVTDHADSGRPSDRRAEEWSKSLGNAIGIHEASEEMYSKIMLDFR